MSLNTDHLLRCIRTLESSAAISESDLPTLVDVMDWARIPQAFREEIEREYVVLQRQKNNDVKSKA